jgi:hypothetical protein
MINKTKFIFLINFLFIVCCAQYSLGMESEREEFEEIKVSNFFRSLTIDVKFWKEISNEEEQVTAFIVTHENLPEDWELYQSFPGGLVRVYARVSDQKIKESEKYKRKLEKFSLSFQEEPGTYQKLREHENTLMSFSQHNYETYPLSLLTQDIQKAHNIIFALGAGISAYTISDLSSAMTHLGLVQVPSSDTATANSYKGFAEKLMTDTVFRKSVLKGAREFNDQLYLQEKKEPTKAHAALGRIIPKLRLKGKTIYVYSSNIDELEKEVGIELDEAIDTAGEVTSIIPSFEMLTNRHTTVISIGKSYDHDADLSKLYSKLSEIEHCATYEFFNLNLKTNPIVGFKDCEAEKGHFVIPMKVVLEDIQINLPALEDELTLSKAL